MSYRGDIFKVEQGILLLPYLEHQAQRHERCDISAVPYPRAFYSHSTYINQHKPLNFRNIIFFLQPPSRDFGLCSQPFVCSISALTGYGNLIDAVGHPVCQLGMPAAVHASITSPRPSVQALWHCIEREASSYESISD